MDDIEQDQIAYGREMLKKEEGLPFLKGICIYWKSNYGFIKVYNVSMPHVFIDRRDIITKDYFKKLDKHDEVRFQVEKTDKGYKARNLTVIGVYSETT